MTENRTYRQTHPWITFDLDLRKAPASLWLVLGECQSKCQHIAGVPLRPEVAKRLNELYLARGSAATIAIEGNTLTEEQVLRSVRGKLRLPKSQAYLQQEAENIVTQFRTLEHEVSSGNWSALTPEIIQSLNRGVLHNLDLAEEVVPGRFRSHSVGVFRYRGAPAEDCAHLVAGLCRWLESDLFKAPEGHEIAYAVIQSIIAHIYLAWIHPFADGNGRTARLVEYLLLLRAGVPAPAAHLLSSHYNRTRQEYYRQLDRTSASGGELIPFLCYAASGFLDGLRTQLSEIRDQVWDTTWRSFVHEQFRDKSRRAHVRKRDLVLDLSRKASPVRLSQMRSVSPRVSVHYARVSDRTLIRDVNELIGRGLIERTENGYRAAREIILSFLPVKTD